MEKREKENGLLDNGNHANLIESDSRGDSLACPHHSAVSGICLKLNYDNPLIASS